LLLAISAIFQVKLISDRRSGHIKLNKSLTQSTAGVKLTSNHFWSLVMGKTRSQVTIAMGEPDEIEDFDDGGRFTSSWVYENRIEYPASSRSEKGSNAIIYFDSEVVDRIIFY
jgi:outer membrane protein assembly factor BamE (lipoprotein component of BamABCDE complex)